MTLEFYFDFSCPYAYLAACRVRDVARARGVAIELRPILLGGVFNSLGHQPMETFGAAKQRHNMLDMARQAALHGVELNMPAAHPMRTVSALRMLLAAPRERWWSLIDAIYRAYWVEGRAVHERAVLRELADGVGLDGAALVSRIDDPGLKAELRTRTDEAVARGVFGVPTFAVGDELFWGQDRLELALTPRPPLPDAPSALGEGEKGRSADTVRLARSPSPSERSERQGEGQAREARRGEGPQVTFYFDFSSPFAYLASERIEALCARHGAHLVWHPMLLGAVFKEVGTPMVPLHAMPEAKQRMARRDMVRFAALYDVPFTFPSRFPMRTVDALRLWLAVQEQHPGQAPALAQRIFRAYWAEDRDINDLGVLAECCRRVALDPAPLLDARSTPPIKARLFACTQAAVEAGVFGAPSFRVEGDARALVWGQDRLAVVEALLDGTLDG